MRKDTIIALDYRIFKKKKHLTCFELPPYPLQQAKITQAQAATQACLWNPPKITLSATVASLHPGAVF